MCCRPAIIVLSLRRTSEHEIKACKCLRNVYALNIYRKQRLHAI